MPAPPAALVTALRNGDAHRHVFFKLAHAGGAVLAWDGVGERVFNAETYLGVAGMARVEGVSQSSDLQNHVVSVTLNGVELPSLSETSLRIRDEAAELWAAWIAEDNSTVAQKLIFKGRGLAARVVPEGDKMSIVALLRGAMADWRASPRAYYTDADWQRQYPGDDGFSFVKNLENAVVSGWSVNEESSGGIPYKHPMGTSSFFDSVDGATIGDHEHGPTAWVNNTTHAVTDRFGTAYLEDVTGAAITYDTASPYPMRAGGVNCYIDGTGDVRTPGGELVVLTGWLGTTNHRLRRGGAIASSGTATATKVLGNYAAGYIPLRVAGGSYSTTGADQTKQIYCNGFGALIRTGFGVLRPYDVGVYLDTGAYVYYNEDVTGAAATIDTGSGELRVGGVACVMSTTGVVLSPGGRRIVRAGGDPATDFLRAWT